MILKQLFSQSAKCPYCSEELSTKPSRKEGCPHCGGFIRVRDGKLMTEENAQIHDWLERLDYFGITKKDFQEHRKNLSEQFGFKSSVNDTIWRILNSLVGEYARDSAMLEHIYREMAGLVSKEGKDPTPYLSQAQNVKMGRSASAESPAREKIFLGHDELAYVRRLRSEGKYQKANELLKRAEPSPAVLDEVRKISSARAKAAKKEGNWTAVVEHLSGYSEYADEMREYCIAMVNQAPPEHTATDKKLLAEAQSKLAKS